MKCLLVLLLALHASAAERLCFIGGECLDYACGQKVRATDDARRFVIAGGRTYSFGILPEHKTKPSCREKSSLHLIAVRDVPEQARLTATNKQGATWSVSLRKEQWKEPITLALAPGEYEIAVEAAHFVPWSKSVTAPHPRLDVEFRRLLVISGSIIDKRTEEPIAGAAIGVDEKTQAVTDATGAFQFEADPLHWPKTLTLTRGGYGAVSVPLPAARVDTALGAIGMSHGATIDIALTESEPGQVRGFELIELQNEGRAVKRQIAGKNFQDIEAGEYVLVAKGERLGEPVTLEAGARVIVPLVIKPFELRVRVEDSESRLPHTEVLLRNRDLHWEGSFETDEQGEASLQLWQGGRLEGTVVVPGKIPSIHRRLVESSDDEWVIALPNYELRGVVVDAKTGKPIANAALVLAMRSEEKYSLNVKADTDEKGVFCFAPIAYGKHVLHAAARDYPPIEIPIEFHAPDVHREITVKLTRGDSVQIQVVNERGQPIAGALVAEYAGLRPGARSVTDANGRAELSATERENTLYVIPRDGSFAIVPLKAGEMRVVVRDGLGSIELRAQSEGAEPIPDVSVVTRYNGTVLPLEIVHTLAEMHGWRPRADGEGRILFHHVPAGTYEFWPVGSNAEFLALAAGLGPRAPVTMAVGPGENVAVLSFSRQY